MTDAKPSSVCVYCASSQAIHPEFHAAAAEVGRVLAEANLTIVYGGGGAGSMGALADGALEHQGHVVGVLPRFMDELEWGHRGLAKLELVEDMRTRKHRMLEQADAVVALPGGCGTYEELFEALTLKRLGIFFGPIILLNTRGYYDACARLLEQAVQERFMNPEHADMWQIVDTPEAIVATLETTPRWSSQAREFAVVRTTDAQG